MKISDLQKELRKIKREHGDLTVKMADVFEAYSPDNELTFLGVKILKNSKYVILGEVK